MTKERSLSPVETVQTLSDRVKRIKPSPTLAVSARAEELQAEGKNIINLGVGEPDFDTPQHIKDAAIKAINEGHTKYTAVDGIKPLRQAIVDKFARENQLNYQLNQIIVSCGAKHSLFNVFSVILNHGDEVIIPAPYWVSYPDMVKLLDGTPVIVATDLADQFKMTADALRKAITAKTRAVVLNSPSNPTGMAYTRQELEALAEVLLEYPNIMVISDDIYEHSLWQHLPFVNILNVAPELADRTCIVNGVAKSYAMTGWRIGYTAGPTSIITAMKKAQSQSTSNACTISQYATLAALTGSQAAVSMMTKAYKERHDYLIAALKEISGFDCIPSDGTFYTFPKISSCYRPELGITDDLTFAEFLLTKAEVAVIPGSAFGTPDYIRISFATKMEHIKTAVEKIKHALLEIK